MLKLKQYEISSLFDSVKSFEGIKPHEKKVTWIDNSFNDAIFCTFPNKAKQTNNLVFL